MEGKTSMTCKCGGTIFESIKAVINFTVAGGEATFTTDGLLCADCKQINVQFKIQAKPVSEVRTETLQ